MSRIPLLLPCLLVLACAGTPRAHSNQSVARDAFDREVHGLMRRNGFRGAQIAVARDEELTLSRAYGDATPETAVTVHTRFRIASLSKALTAVVVHMLVDEGRLVLDAPVLPHLRLREEPVDPRWADITVRHLLEHSAGFDRHESRDWMFESNFVAKDLGLDHPPELDDIVRFVSARPLDFTPGARFAYSNLGYALLGRVIEDVTGESYEAVTRNRILTPIGADRVQLGRTRLEDRAPDEAFYFPHPAEATWPSVFPGEGAVASPDGGFYLPPMAAHGGWIASASDLARFLVHLDGRPAPADLLPPARLEALLAPPHNPTFRGDDEHYAHGFFVRRTRRGRAWLHDGSKPGTTSFMMRDDQGTVMVALFNGRPVRGDVSRDVETTLHAAWRAIR